MSERKVLNKYYPPDYDPSKIPRLKQKRDGKFGIRLMAPFNMRCNTCGEYIYKGKKFNARKEDAEGEFYLGLRIYRFYIKCPRCVAEIAFKTDPENTDYTLEAGATRNFEALRTAERLARQELAEQEEEERNNPMKLLENRTKASLQEMDMIETLEELRELRQKQSSVNLQAVIEDSVEAGKERAKQQRQREQEEDEQFVKSLFGEEATRIVKRLDSDDEDDDGDEDNSSTNTRKSENGSSDASTCSDEPARKKLKAATSGKPSDLLLDDVSASAGQSVKFTANAPNSHSHQSSSTLTIHPGTVKPSTTTSSQQKLLAGIIVRSKGKEAAAKPSAASTEISSKYEKTASEFKGQDMAGIAKNFGEDISAKDTAGTKLAKDSKAADISSATDVSTSSVKSVTHLMGLATNSGSDTNGMVGGGLASLASYSSSDSEGSDS